MLENEASRAITLQEASEEYLKALEAAGKSPMTLYTYGKDFDQIRAFWGPDRALSEISKAQVGKFLKSPVLLEKPNGKERAPQTIRKTIRVLRMFLLWAKERGYLEEAPIPNSVPMGRSKPPNQGGEEEPEPISQQ